MRGPNLWSIRRHKLIVVRLDLEEMEERPSNLIDGFLDRMKTLMPSLYLHRCSEGCDGGFFMRKNKGLGFGAYCRTYCPRSISSGRHGYRLWAHKEVREAVFQNVVFILIWKKAGIYEDKKP